MELYVIRHGESKANAGKRFSGWSQVPLSEKGEEQAVKTGELLKNITFDRIISSDQYRAKQTAEHVFPGLTYTEDWRLRELHVGEMLQDRPRSECVEEYGQSVIDAMNTRDFTAFGGENAQNHLDRVTEFMDDLAQYPEDSRIAVVCHAGTICSMLSYVLHTLVSHKNTFTDNAGVAVFKRQEGNWLLYKWNETGTCDPSDLCGNRKESEKESNSLALQIL